MRRVIKALAIHISSANQYTKAQEEQVEYAIRIFTFELLKIIGTVLAFSMFGYTMECIIALGTMVTVKPYIGGYHENTQIKCFTVSLLIIAAIIYLSISLNMNLTSKLILNSISFYCIWNQAPVINPTMTLTNEKLVKRNRLVGISITAFFILISLVFYKNNLISNTIVWTIVFQALLMFNKR